MSEAARRTWTYEAYLQLERETDRRHAWLDGRVWAMAGGSPRHSALKLRVGGTLMQQLLGGPCIALDSDCKVVVQATGLATYPDVSVVCGDLERAATDTNAIVNPTLIVEVLSDSTEWWDRGGKFQHYQQIPGLRHYVLVSTVEPRIEHFARADGGAWSYRSHGAGDRLILDDLGVRLDVDTLHDRLPEEPPPRPAAEPAPTGPPTDLGG
jgi:Uma2 family endonuclease